MRSRFPLLCAVSVLTILTGCGGGTSGSTATGSGDFSLAIVPSSITITPGGAAQAVTLAASPMNGFSGNVSVTVGSLPGGVTATPMTLSIAPGGLQQISVSREPGRCGWKRYYLPPGYLGLTQS